MEILRLDESLATEPPNPEDFTGRVRMQNLGAAGGTSELDYLAVYFDAGAHTRPHTHETDQVLCFVRGTGLHLDRGRGTGSLSRRAASSSSPPASSTCTARRRRSRSATSPSARPGPTDWSPPVPDEWQQYVR